MPKCSCVDGWLRNVTRSNVNLEAIQSIVGIQPQCSLIYKCHPLVQCFFCLAGIYLRQVSSSSQGFIQNPGKGGISPLTSVPLPPKNHGLESYFLNIFNKKCPSL